MMMKKLIILLACLGLVFSSGCTSKESKEDAEVASDLDSADLEKIEGDEALEISGDDTLSSDSLAEDALGETAPSVAAEEPAATEPAPSDVATTETLPSDPFAESSTQELPPPPAESSTTIVDAGEPKTEEAPLFGSSTTETASEPVEAPKTVSLQKIATTPWKSGKKWLNTVYFARPGDSLSSISQMIYGSNKVSELKKGNPTFNSRGVKPGDKIYYNSPNRPDDSSRVLTYHEDNGIAPEVYVAKEGDNIRKVAQEILGYPNAWKEVWSSNAVDSKGEIAAGTELRYWKGAAVAAAQPPTPPPAQQEIAGGQVEQMPPAPPQDFPPPPDMAMPPAEQMPPTDMAQMPPPPPMPESGDMAPPPPPPADMAQMPPPPPPPEAMNPPAPPQQAGEEAPVGMDNDTTMALAVVGLAAAGLAILIVMRKKRKQRELEQSLNETHVG